ncbi:MAG: hypothetical protein IPM56_07120 [Ignavibacteriales bacterium]|nr:MAG: hypothetical protein IPM56_07120 [Ignavibacteriales bacterium]
MASKIFDKAKEQAEALKNKISDIGSEFWDSEKISIIQEFKESGTDKIKDVVKDLNQSSEIFKRGGFKLTEVEVTLGLPPEIVVLFDALEKVSDEEKEILVKELEGRRMILLVLSSLFKARSFFEVIKFGEYKLQQVKISLGLTPGISIIFS